MVLMVQLKGSRLTWLQKDSQSYGIDYQETFVLIAKINTICILLFVAANLYQKISQSDIKNVFLNGELIEEVFMDTPLGFEDSYGIDTIFILKKSLYGLKQSPRAWFDSFSKIVKKLSYTQAQSIIHCFSGSLKMRRS